MSGCPPMTKVSSRRQLLSIEGGIGIGKTTAMNRLRERFGSDRRVVFVDEPVDDWESSGLLKAMYNDKDGSLRPTFQLMALMTRFGKIFKALQMPGVALIITERSPFTDAAVFAKANLSKEPERACYDLAYKSLLAAVPDDIDVSIALLTLDTTSLASRVKARNRASESAVDFDYLDSINQLHETFYQGFECGSKTRIDAGQSPEAVSSTLADLTVSLLHTKGETTASPTHQNDVGHEESFAHENLVHVFIISLPFLLVITKHACESWL